MSPAIDWLRRRGGHAGDLPPDPEWAVRLAARPALAIVREYPPRHAARRYNMFGGLPLAPPEFKWPRRRLADGSTRPMAFLAQIDCAELPDFVGREQMPLNGALFFFVDFDTATPAVVHLPGPAADWVIHPPPPDAPPVLGQATAAAAPWIGYLDDAARRLPRSFPRWPIRLGVVDTFAAADSPYPMASAEGMAFAELCRVAGLDALARAFGPALPWRAIAPRAPVRRGAAWRPFKGFPHTWRAVDWAAGAVWLEAARLAQGGDAAWAHIADEARAWLIGAREQQPMAAPGAEAQAAFWAWLDSVAGREPSGKVSPARIVARALESVASLAAEVSLTHSTDSAARLPAETVEILLSRHHPLRRSMADDRIEAGLRHQMLGAPIAGEAVEGEVLLLQLVSDPAMLWRFGDGDGVCRFWIGEADLKAGRFSRARLAVTAV